MAHVTPETEKFHGLPPASWRSRKAGKELQLGSGGLGSRENTKPSGREGKEMCCLSLRRKAVKRESWTLLSSAFASI